MKKNTYKTVKISHLGENIKKIRLLMGEKIGRLDRRKQSKAISQQELVELLEEVVTQKQVSVWEAGKNDPHPAVLDKLALVFGVDKQTLRAGDLTRLGRYPALPGQQHNGAASAGDVPLVITAAGRRASEERTVPETLRFAPERVESPVPTAQMVLVPRVVGALRVGEHGYEMMIDDLSLTVAEMVPVVASHLKRRGPRCVIRVEGRSMEPAFYDGDEVLVNLGQVPLEYLRGKEVAAWVPEVGGALIKILKRNHIKTGWTLHAVNNEFDDIPIANDQPHFHAYEVEAITFHSVRRPSSKESDEAVA